MPLAIEIVRARPTDAEPVASLHLAARARALPSLRPAHTDEETRDWVRTTLLVRVPTWVARLDGEVVAFMSAQGEHVDQLYVQPGYERRGLGLRLLELAKRGCDRLTLCTFQRNTAARAFCDAHGFRPIGFGDGSGNEEPDVFLEWTKQ